ncbi:MAG: ATP-binding protein [Promethearchaeota archaeon]
MKKLIVPLAENAVFKDSEDKKYFNLGFFTPLKWIYQISVIGGGIINRIPKNLLNFILRVMGIAGFDFSKFLMASLPHQNFTKSVSIIFLPESKNIKLKTSDGKMIVPHDLAIEMLERVCAYDTDHSIAQIYYCICRMCKDCKEYPKDLGCMIVGPGAKDVVERGMGKYIKLEDAITQIQKIIIPSGLSSFISIFPTDLHHIWGVKTFHSKYTFELCFCCTCCCVLKKPHFFIPNETYSGPQPFIDIRGFKAKIDLNKCTGCGNCIEFCPLKRINLIEIISKEGLITKKASNKNCIGCGNCVSNCSINAIEIIPTESFDRLEELLGVFEYYDLKKENFLKKLNDKYQERNRKL